MKCYKCGADTNDSLKFCENCGCKFKESNSHNADSRYINIGYPLGYKAADDSGIVYIIDNGKKIVELTQELAAVWSGLYDNEEWLTGYIDTLHQIECVIDINDGTDIDILGACRLFRQGFGSEFDGKHAIYLGATPIVVNETLLNIWQLSNGENTIEQIASKLHIDIITLINLLLELLKVDLVYIVFGKR